MAPVAEIVELAKKAGARVLLDACQSVPHMRVDVRALGVDWIVASSHKMCGPTGIGFLWGTAEALESMPPWMGGGEMIQDVFLDHSTYAQPPARFEAGTPAIAEAIGAEWRRCLGTAVVPPLFLPVGGALLWDAGRGSSVARTHPHACTQAWGRRATSSRG